MPVVLRSMALVMAGVALLGVAAVLYGAARTQGAGGIGVGWGLTMAIGGVVACAALFVAARLAEDRPGDRK